LEENYLSDLQSQYGSSLTKQYEPIFLTASGINLSTNLTGKSAGEMDGQTYKRSQQAKKSPLFNAVRSRYLELLGLNSTLYLKGNFTWEKP
jgi:hypothetical protein